MLLEKNTKEAKALSGDLGKARVVIGIGRGLRSEGTFAEVLTFAERIGAQIAGTRAPVDMQWVSEDREVGLSGRRITPDLYIAIGLSGANFHTIGMHTAKKIIAINTDKKARIFRIADFCVYEDADRVLRYLLNAENLEKLSKRDTSELAKRLVFLLKTFPHSVNSVRRND